MKKRVLIFILMAILIIISFFVGGSYAYFNPVVIGNETAKTQVVKAGPYEIVYDGTNQMNIANIEPGESVSTTFSVYNNSAVTQYNYQISFGAVINNFSNNELKYQLSCTSDGGGSGYATKSLTTVPKIGGLIATASSINAQGTHIYTLTVSLADTGSNQNYNINKSASFNIYINQTEVYPVIKKIISSGLNAYRSSITSITFDLTETPPAGYTDSGNIDADNLGLAKWYVVGTNAYIHSKTMMVAPTSMSQFLYNFSALTTINNLQYLNTSNVTSMHQLVSYCGNLTGIDLSSFDTENVTDASSMFYLNSSNKTIRLDNFNLAKSGLNVGSMFVSLSDNASNKGKIYVKDNASAAVACNQLKAAGGTIKTTNELFVVSESNTFYPCV